MQQLPEHFLQFVWENKYFQLFDLRTNKGLPITIVNIGKKNYGAGADFWNATIYIGDVQLEGDVEIHVRASDWRRHKHQFDKNYNNVILHVVYEDDEVAYNKLGNAVDCLYFAPLINSDVLNKYAHLSKQSTFIPCQSHIMEHLKLLEEMWLPKLAWERIQRKAEKISRQFEEQTSDYEKIFYQLICRSITNYTNEYPMDILSKIVPFKLVQLYSHSVFMLESLFFGQADLLPAESEDEYINKLKAEYSHLKAKHNLRSMEGHQWKFLRIQPAGFPTIRIAQLVQFINKSPRILADILEQTDITKLEGMFRNNLHSFWNNRYTLDEVSDTVVTKRMGKASIHNLLINSVATFLFAYGYERKISEYCKRAIAIWEFLPAENNNIISNWKKLGLKPDNAFYTQALLELKKIYCEKRLCYNCDIGKCILSPEAKK